MRNAQVSRQWQIVKALANSNNTTYMTLGYFTQMLGVSYKTVLRDFNALVSVGLIRGYNFTDKESIRRNSDKRHEPKEKINKIDFDDHTLDKVVKFVEKHGDMAKDESLYVCNRTGCKYRFAMHESGAIDMRDVRKHKLNCKF